MTMEHPDHAEYPDYAELFSSVACGNPSHRRIRQSLKYSGPMLIMDFFHVFPGEVVSIKEIPNVLARDKGIYRVLLFEADDIEKRISEITCKLAENEHRLGKWKVVFTNPGRYKGFYEFRRFVEDSGNKLKELVLL
jgi:hypothetical protein